MASNIVPTFTITLWIAGDIETARRRIHERAYFNGMCVTLTPTTFVYTGGEEAGMAIGFVSYPRSRRSPGRCAHDGRGSHAAAQPAIGAPGRHRSDGMDLGRAAGGALVIRRVVVGFSGGVTSAWCAGWALRTFPREEVILLWHDTKEEHPDTYRFLLEMSAKLEHPITEQSDGRSVTQLFRDEEFLGNNQNTMCSRVLKAEQDERFQRVLRAGLGGDGWQLARAYAPEGVPMCDEETEDVEIVKVVGYSAKEPKRVHRMVGHCALTGTLLRFPVIEEGVSKQDCADWCQCTMGVKPSAMYEWAEHANCVGCVKGVRAYWLAVAREHPDVFEQRADMEEEFGHSIIRGENPIMLRDLVKVGLKRTVNQKEKIEIGACDCGD